MNTHAERMRRFEEQIADALRGVLDAEAALRVAPRIRAALYAPPDGSDCEDCAMSEENALAGLRGEYE